MKNIFTLLLTFISSILSNSTSVIIKNEPDAHVGRYIKRSDVAKIYESRKAKVYEYVRNAEKSEKLARVDDALRNFYWAYSNIKSIDNGETREARAIPMAFDDIAVKDILGNSVWSLKAKMIIIDFLENYKTA